MTVPAPDLVGLVDQQAEAHPQDLATSGPAGRLSYADLGRCSRRVARELDRLGVRPGDIVAVCMEQDHRLPAVLLGIARLRAAFVPLDLRHPVDRLRYQLEDCGAGLVVAAGRGTTQAAELAHGAEPEVRVVDLADLEADPATDSGAEETPDPTRVAEPDDLVYVIYTSGSSGKPKGVEVTRGNLATHLAAMGEVLPMEQGAVMTTIAGISFDITQLGIWGPLAGGGSCVLLDEETFVDGDLLAERLQEEGVTILQATPTSLRTLAAAGWRGDPSLRVMSGGEALDADLAQTLVGGVAELWNFYGPTEATIWATAHRVRPGEQRVPIGRPLPGYEALVLDEAGASVPTGETGELWLQGPGVARGYHARPEATARAFEGDLADPLARRYRTGDRARWGTDDTLEFLGRFDDQVKVRGYRIELGEVETWVRAFDGVRDAAVTVEGSGAGSHLVGHVVWAGEADSAALSTFLGSRVPDYMVPRRWTSIAALPTLPSGKVDRVALRDATGAARADEHPDQPGPEAGSTVPEEAPAEQPSAVEAFLAQAWSEILEAPHIERTDSFFDRGGHSFAATLVVGRIRSTLGCRVPVRVLFDNPVLADFAVEVERLAMADLEAAESAEGA